MQAAECIVGSAVTVVAADEFYEFIDGWRGVVKDQHQGNIWIECLNPEGAAVKFLVPPDQLARG